MSSLSDCLGRLETLVSSIRSEAATVGRTPTAPSRAATSSTPSTSTSSAGPFTRALLDTPLGDLIRDIDPSELGLFTLVQPPQAHAEDDDAHAQKAEIARIALPIATPLRRPPAATYHRRDEGVRPGEYDPEVYARAALKLLDRYQSIRQMPRYSEQAEQIIQQLVVTRKSIAALNEKLKQLDSAVSHDPNASPKALVQEQERRIEATQAQIEELRRRKEALLGRQRRGPFKAPISKSKPKPAAPSPPPTDPQEETFWNTPGAKPRTLHFVDNLLTDESMDIADVSAMASPAPQNMPRRGLAREMPRAGPSRGKVFQFSHQVRDAHDSAQSKPEPPAPEPEQAPPEEDEDNGGDSDGDKTVMLDRAESPPARAAATPDTSMNMSSASHSHSRQASDADTSRVSDVPDGSTRKPKTKHTADVERIVAKIWATVGDLLMPGHSFDVSGADGSKRPPRAKETIAHLRSLVAQQPDPSSPSAASSTSFSTLSTIHQQPGRSDQPTAQQIATAQLLLALLSSPPEYSMSLGGLKEVLSGGLGQSAGSMVTRPIYGCVAKRLLRITRGGGEQVVWFDV